MTRVLKHLRHRPSLVAALAVAVVVGAAAAPVFRWTTALLLGWDVGIVVYVALVLALMSRATITSMRERARLLDQGKWTVLVVATLAALASLAAIIAELVAAKGTPGAPYSIALAGVTVLLSWAFVHFFFAQQYAHDYWLEGHGLDFPGNDAPTYSEFLYFSFTVGMTAQLSDVTTRSATMRKVVLMHGLLSFLFNTAVLASGINLAASLAG
ncbi:DUF1345 domain-containing protein [Azospirillum sp. sgz302134]